MRCTTRRRSSPRCELVELGVRAVTRQRRESSSRKGQQHDSGKKAARAGAEMSALVSSSTYLLLLEKEAPRSFPDGETRQRPVLRNHIEGTRVPDHGVVSGGASPVSNVHAACCALCCRGGLYLRF